MTTQQSARSAAVAYVRSLTTGESSPDHVLDVCRLAAVKFELSISAGQLHGLVKPATLHGFGRITVVSPEGQERVWGGK